MKNDITLEGKWGSYLLNLMTIGAVRNEDETEAAKANFYAGAAAAILILQYFAENTHPNTGDGYEFYKKFMALREEIRREADKYTEVK